MANFRGLLENTKTALKEDQALAAGVSAGCGVVAAVMTERLGPEADPTTFAVTASEARSSLLSMLALVFTALSIVLALTALTTSNMASKFSPRVLRMHLRGNENKWVLAVFALTASFILASQVLLASRTGDELAPPLTMAVSVLLLVTTSVLIVWYINGTLQSLRVDEAIRWTGLQIRRAAHAHERALRHDDVVDEVAIERPSDALDLEAPEDGVIDAIDTGRLDQLTDAGETTVVLEAGTGTPVVAGEVIGWMSGPSSARQEDSERILGCVTIARTQDPDSDVGYTISTLVDIGLMALSPAVNDPRTGVECAKALTEAFRDLRGTVSRYPPPQAR